jgi:hypothetical protein
MDGNWKVTAVAPGTARITASSEGVEAHIGVRVVAVPAGPSGGYTIEKVSGDGQTAYFGQELPLQLVVRVLRAGYPVANAQVTWTSARGAGSSTPTATRGRRTRTGGPPSAGTWPQGRDPDGHGFGEGGGSVQYTAHRGARGVRR